MLYQDRLGMLYEIPDGQVYGHGYAEPYGPDESQILYDGLGNPVGAWPFSNIAKAVGGLVSKALPVVAPFIPGGSLISQALPAMAQGMVPGPPAPAAPVAQPTTPMPYQGAVSPMPGMPGAMIPAPGGPMPMPRPWPHGWVRPPLPYTGLGPQRLYLRCAVWPGPKGLVPAIAAQAPAAQAQAAGAAAAQTAAAMIRRRHHHRRR
jgi:hypothetical protein